MYGSKVTLQKSTSVTKFPRHCDCQKVKPTKMNQIKQFKQDIKGLIGRSEVKYERAPSDDPDEEVSSSEIEHEPHKTSQTKSKSKKR